MVWLHALFALLVNAIPAWGVFALGWSVGVLLILFWIENLVGVLFSALRLHLHQSRSPDPHYRDARSAPRMTVNGKSVRFDSHARGFLSMALPFALAHGLFAILLPFAFAQDRGGVNAALWTPRWDDLKLGAALVGLALLLDLLVDLPGLARRSAASVKAQADARMGRVILLHVVIIFGAIATAQFESPYGMLAVMLGLKTLVDLASVGAGRAKKTPASGEAGRHPPSTLERLEVQAESRLTPQQRAQRDRSR
jgi:hypothetical protein